MVDEKTRKRWKKEDELMEGQKRTAESYTGVNPIVYSAPSGSAYPSEPILTSKVSGWVGVFGDHYLCEAGCKKYVSKRLDDVIKFFEREIRLWYKAKELAKKGKLDVEVKGHVRKSRKKKIDTSKHSEIFGDDKNMTDEQKKLRKARYEEGICDDVVDEKEPDNHEEHIKANIEYAEKLVKDEVEKGKVLFVKDENIKVKE